MQIDVRTAADGRITYVVRFDRYRKNVIDRLRETVTASGRRWDAREMAWIIPASNAAKAQIEELARYVQNFEQVRRVGAPPVMQSEQDYQLPELPTLDVPHGLKIEPYPYQLKGIAQGLKLKRFINADDMGLGKSLESIATVNLADAYPCLVICPNVVKINWQREWERFTQKKAMVLTDSVQSTWPFFWQTGMNQVFIVNYESLKKYFVRRINKPSNWMLKDVVFNENIKMFKSVIIDESHRVKTTKTHQSKFCKGIAQGKEYILMLTGTPVVNKPKDLISQLGILDRLNDLGGWKMFMQRYCSGPNEASNLKELNYNLWKTCFFRREKSKVLTQLPDKIRQVVTVDITNRKEYADAERDLIDYLKRYKEADDERIMRAMRGEVMVRIGILKDITARGKLKDVVEFVNDFRESGKKLVIFCNLHDIVDKLLQFYPKAVCITGRQNFEEKQASIDKFQNDQNTDIAICSIKAASAGITLTAASDVAFVELPWTYADCDQAESRCHRIGQKNSVTSYYLLGRDTIDMKIYSIIETKKKIHHAILGSTDAVETNIVDMIAKMFEPCWVTDGLLKS